MWDLSMLPGYAYFLTLKCIFRLLSVGLPSDEGQSFMNSALMLHFVCRLTNLMCFS